MGGNAYLLDEDGIDYPRNLEIHHIAKHLRNHGRWNLSRLCKMCHDLAEGHRIRYRGKFLPSLSAANVLWMKRTYDRENYDRGKLKEYWRHLDLPIPKRPDKFFLAQMTLYRGEPYPFSQGENRG